jgi:hypothetical protein
MPRPKYWRERAMERIEGISLGGGGGVFVVVVVWGRIF